ncbi:DNA polymerase III subunit delta' [Kaistella sp. PBT33-4]|uniref:DNA polymerase III subunit n=1 Tax=Kaistella sp. PBT33-4 TaxID=3032000 RepID=UPI0023D7CD2F|nr:DNA polymerase III subunit delta' [Kaistella sp. PBT33-4]MDF0720722.1 DNA polymerase III subunit delta' [Kaistella sp. PBT33-4]
MDWDLIAGQQLLKDQLRKSIQNQRISHAQLFLGKEGYGTLPLALAYAGEILEQEKPAAAQRVSHLNHVDLHFSFPVFTANRSSLSQQFFYQFREMILANPYSSFDDWSSFLESENKQLFISADEVEEQNKKFALKSFEGGSKILIIWRADKLNVPASNKLLKFLEEPPEKTVILLTAENADDLLPTILSRTQLVQVPRLSDTELGDYLSKNFKMTEDRQKSVIHKSQGNLNTALKLMQQEGSTEFEELFVQWVRDAFQVKKRPEFLKNIILWARSIAGWNREKQKNFLEYCAEMFRMAMIQNYGAQELVHKKIESGSFNWDSFSKFIHGANIESIITEINEADYHLQRNANPRIVWTDLGIKLSRYIHKTA